MVGQITYTEDQILFILRLTLAKEKRDVILHKYQERFNKLLTASQLRYVKSKYGHDPEFGTALINGTVPKNGGNRKTARPLPSNNSAGTAQNLGTASKSISISRYSPTLAPPTEYHDVHQLVPNGSSFSPSTMFSAQPQQEIQGQSLPSTQQYVPLKHTKTHHTMMSATASLLQHSVTPVYHPNNPSSVQSVPQHYNATLHGSTSGKRKREESPKQEGPGIETAGSDAHVRGADLIENPESKRVKLEASGTSTSLGTFLQQNSEMLQYFDPNLFGRLDFTQTDDGGLPEALWDQFLSELDATVLASDNVISASSPQLPQLGHNADIYGDCSGQEMTASNQFLIPQSDAACAQSTSPDPSVPFLGTDMSPYWSPAFDDADPGLWNNIHTDFQNHTLPNMTAVDAVVDPSLAPCIDTALLTAAADGFTTATEPYSQQWDHVDMGLFGSNLITSFAPLDSNTNWNQLSSLGDEDVDGHSSLQPYPSPLTKTSLAIEEAVVMDNSCISQTCDHRLRRAQPGPRSCDSGDSSANKQG